MADHIELEIRKLLKSSYAALDVVVRLAPLLQDPQLPQSDRRSIVSFALNSGAIRPVLDILPQLLEKRSPLPWGHLIEILGRKKITPSKELIEAVIKGARRQELVEDLVLSRAWDKWDPRFRDFRSEIAEERLAKAARQREMLFDKLGFFRNQRLVDEEKRILALLEKIYPEDEEVQGRKLEFEERWARHLISKHAHGDHGEDRTQTLVDPRELAFVEQLTLAMKTIAQSQPAAAYNFAVALVMMEHPRAALDILPLAPESGPRDWLLAEILILAERYVDCLDTLTGLEQRYAGEADTSFGATYLRALALNGLGQTGQALELLQSIVNVRPNYRSAASLLSQWSGSRKS